MHDRSAVIMALLPIALALAGCSTNPPEEAATPSDAGLGQVVADEQVVAGDGGDAPTGGREETGASGSNDTAVAKPEAPEPIEVYNLTATMSGATVFEHTFEAPQGTATLGFGIRGSARLCAGIVRLTVLDAAGNELGAGNHDCAPLGGVGCLIHVTCQLRSIAAGPGTYRLVYDVVGVVHLDVRVYAYSA